MTLSESIVEDAALEWFGEQCRVAPSLIPAFSQREKEAVGHGAAFAGLRRAKPSLAPGEPAAERDSFGEVVQSRSARTLTPALSQKERESPEAIRRPAGAGPAIPEEVNSQEILVRSKHNEKRLNPVDRSPVSVHQAAGKI